MATAGPLKGLPTYQEYYHIKDILNHLSVALTGFDGTKNQVS